VRIYLASKRTGVYITYPDYFITAYFFKSLNFSIIFTTCSAVPPPLVILSSIKVSTMPYQFQLSVTLMKALTSCPHPDAPHLVWPPPITSHPHQTHSKLTCRRHAPRRHSASPCDSAARVSCHPRLHRRSCTRDGPHSRRCVRRGR